MKILFAVTGIGQPHYDHKLEILKHNISKLEMKLEVEVELKIIISFYDNGTIPEWILSRKNIKIVNEPNHVGSFIQKHLTPAEDFDYIFLILDDIQLPDDFDYIKMIKTYKKLYHKKMLLSCTLSTDSKISHQYMVTQENYIIEPELYSTRREKCCEYFFYLMNHKSYERYYSIINSYPKYTERMWGVDVLLDKYRIKAYLSDQIVCKHFYSHGAGAFADVCREQMKKLMKKPHPKL